MSTDKLDITTNTTIGQTIMIAAWVGGWVLAQGFWLMAVAILFPPYGWYLVVEKFMEFFGMIGAL